MFYAPEERIKMIIEAFLYFQPRSYTLKDIFGGLIVDFGLLYYYFCLTECLSVPQIVRVSKSLH